MSLHGDSWCERCSKRAGKHRPPSFPLPETSPNLKIHRFIRFRKISFGSKYAKCPTRYASVSLRTDPWTRFNYHRPLCVIIVCLVIRSMLRQFHKYYRRAILVRRVVLFHTFEINSLPTKGYTEIFKLNGGNPWCTDRLRHYTGNM